MTRRAIPALAASFLAASLASVLVAAPILALAAPTAPAPSAPTAPTAYDVARTQSPPESLLAADEAAWASAAPIDWGPAAYTTRFRALWSDDGLYLRFDATDPSPWHTMTRRDEHLWEEEVVEIFIDPDRSARDYYELEINPANVVCDLRMISPSPDKRGDIDWNLAGLETRVVPLGAASRPRGWTATAFLPWSGLGPLPSAARVAVPPRPGDRWRFNVFRIERPFGKPSPERDAVFAAWSPPSVASFHDASAFRDLVFRAAAR